MAYFLDFDLGGWNHLVIAEVADVAPSDRVVGGGFCVWGVLLAIGQQVPHRALARFGMTSLKKTTVRIDKTVERGEER